MTTTESPAAITRTVDGVELPIAGTYQIDASHTEVSVVARHLVFTKVRARFPEVRGTVVVAEDPSGSTASVEIGAASVDSGDEARDTHLRTADFFDVETHPAITFQSTGLRLDGVEFVLDGDLSIRGVTRPVSLKSEYLGAVDDPWGGRRIAFTASATLDREDWGLTWNVALEAGGLLVGKTATIEIDAELVHQG